MATAESAMKIKALAPWFGAKRTMAPRIVAELGPHRAYWEPFCGSMAVLLAKPAATMETVNDLHGDLINLARVIQHPTLGPALYRRLRRAWMHEELFAMSRAVIIGGEPPADGDLCLDRAAAFFLVAWMGRNGVCGTSNYNMGFAARYTKNGGHAATRLAGAIDSIPEFRRRLRQVTILRRSGFDLLMKIEDAPGSVIYLDPPYIVKGAKYLHDFNADEHEALAVMARRFERTRVVVSYYDHPVVHELYRDWTVVEDPQTKALVSSGQRDGGGAVVAPEVLLINGPSLTSESNP